MTEYLAGIDVGTSSVKAAVYTADGQEMGSARVPTPWTATPHGAQTTGSALLAAAWTALTGAVDGLPARSVAAVGVASMGESGVLLDGSGHPIGPVVAWHDTRDAAEIVRLQQDIAPHRFGRVTGLPASGQWSLTKHRQLVGDAPELARARRRLNVAEWIVRGLGGDEGSELSLASRTGWLELATRTWWPEALEWAGVAAARLPDLIQAGTPLGRVDEAVATAVTGAVLAVAGHDHQVAAVGAGACASGDQLDSCGSAEALLRTVDPYLHAPAVEALTSAGVSVGWHVLPDRWCLLGGTQGGLLLQATLTALGKDRADVPELDRRALDLPAGALEGLLNARFDPAEIARGAEPITVWRAALERAAADIRRLRDEMSRTVGGPTTTTVTGGWANSVAVREVKRRTLGQFDRRVVGESGTRGAALVGGLAAGIYLDSTAFPTPPCALVDADFGVLALDTGSTDLP